LFWKPTTNNPGRTVVLEVASASETEPQSNAIKNAAAQAQGKIVYRKAASFT
jgi:hypothetical protein